MKNGLALLVLVVAGGFVLLKQRAAAGGAGLGFLGDGLDVPSTSEGTGIRVTERERRTDTALSFLDIFGSSVSGAAQSAQTALERRAAARPGR